MITDFRPSAVLGRLANGYQVSQAIDVAAVLGLSSCRSEAPLRELECAAVELRFRAVRRCRTSAATMSLLNRQGDADS